MTNKQIKAVVLSDQKAGRKESKMIEVARILTFGTKNRRDIVRRLMATDFLKNLTFIDAVNTYRYYERNGLVKRTEHYLVVYHDCD